MAEELFWTVLSEIKQKYPEFISGGRRYPGSPWRFKRAIHIVDSTDKITFSKIKFLSFKLKGNTRFLKLPRISVDFFLKILVISN